MVNLNLKQKEELAKEISEQEILNLFNELKNRNLTPDMELYNSLMTVLLGAHKFEQALEIFQEMLVDSHEPNVQTILNLLKIHKCTVYKKNDATNKNDRLNKLDEIFNNFAAKRLPEDLTVKGLNELLEALMNCNKYAPIEKNVQRRFIK